MPARVRINPEQDLCEVTTPEGDIRFLDIEEDEDPIGIITDEADASKPTYAMATGPNDWGLEINQVYQLVKVPTEVETGCEDLNGDV